MTMTPRRREVYESLVEWGGLSKKEEQVFLDMTDAQFEMWDEAIHTLNEEDFDRKIEAEFPENRVTHQGTGSLN